MIGFRHLIQLSLAVYLVSGLPAAELPNNNNKDKVQVFYSRSDRSSAPIQQQQQQQQPIEDPSLKVEVALPASSAAEYYQPQRQVQPVAPVNTNQQQPSNVDGSGGAFFNKFASFMPTNFNLPTSSISSSSSWPSKLMPDFSSLKNPQLYGGHTPLGELWATKADLLPTIVKTGAVVAVSLAAIKLALGLVFFKKSLLKKKFAGVKKLAALKKLAAIKAVKGAAAAVVPAAILKDSAESSDDSKDADEKKSLRKKRAASASPALDSEIDYNEILMNLDTLLTNYLQKKK